MLGAADAVAGTHSSSAANTHRSATTKFTMLSSATAMAFAATTGTWTRTSRPVTITLPRIELRPVAKLNRTNLPNAATPESFELHVQRSCHTKLCTIAHSTARSVAGSHGRLTMVVRTARAKS